MENIQNFVVDQEVYRQEKAELKNALETITALKLEMINLRKSAQKSSKLCKESQEKIKQLLFHIEEIMEINVLLRKNIEDLESDLAKQKSIKKNVFFSKTPSKSSSKNFFFPKSKDIDLQRFSKNFFEVLHLNENAEKTFKSFSSVSYFQDQLVKSDYGGALKTLFLFAKEIIASSEPEDSLFEQLKSENIRLDLLKSELEECYQKGHQVLSTPSSSYHTRGSSYSTILFGEDSISNVRKRKNTLF